MCGPSANNFTRTFPPHRILNVSHYDGVALCATQGAVQSLPARFEGEGAHAEIGATQSLASVAMASARSMKALMIVPTCIARSLAAQVTANLLLTWLPLADHRAASQCMGGWFHIGIFGHIPPTVD